MLQFFGLIISIFTVKGFEVAGLTELFKSSDQLSKI